ncbi:hypothetical protein V6N11_010173 [Hibiscus sabdariffa]|uniref:Uncharacterized protein n=1 Tax=Hibiscus sabdariffa TaxID=183260 RepID=A0ABR2PDY8_9ROSI
MVAGSKLQVEDETLNTCVIGKERNKSEAANDFGSSRFLGESDLKSNENNVVIPSNNVISSGEGKLGVEQEKCIPDSSNDKEKGRAEKTTNGRIEDMAQEVVMVGLDNNPISWADIVSNNLKGHNDGNYLDPTMACNQIVGGAIAVEKPSYFPSSTGPRRVSYLSCFWFDVWIVFQERSFALATVGAVHTDFGGKLKSFWLVSVAAALWVLWCARNVMIFNKKASTAESCLFQAKLRPLIWLKSANGKAFGELDGCGGCRFHGKESVGLRGSAGVRQGVECCELSGYDPVAAVVLFVLLCWRLGDSNRAALYYKFLV